MIQALASAIIATAYITCIAILSCVQFRRSQTPLRLGAAVMAVIGLSISVLSIVYVTDRVSLSIFWVYQSVAECIAMTWVITTIIHLGYAFYPITRHQTLIWRTALASVILYDLVAMAELSYYCYAVWGTGKLAKEAAPVLWIYWVRQLVKVLASTVTIAYLFPKTQQSQCQRFDRLLTIDIFVFLFVHGLTRFPWSATTTVQA
ncbi:hypothetical protein EDD21DRAFT_402217 [Dissophora ornata]|nr:hypothetical protein EDD21DRAFT_402217 [Dissophora ornata]